MIHQIFQMIIHQGLKRGVNMKVIGVFKLENGVRQIILFIGLRPKMYTFKLEEKKEGEKEMKGEKKVKEENKTEIVKAKGVKECVIKNSLASENFNKCLFSEEKLMRDMNIFRTKNHDIYSTTVNKVALSADDDKRIINPDKIDTIALRLVSSNETIYNE